MSTNEKPEEPIVFHNTGLEIQIYGYGFGLNLGHFSWYSPNGSRRWMAPWVKTKLFNRMIYSGMF